MGQSSALRREEPAPDPTPITIDGQGVPAPRDTSIPSDGSVIFHIGNKTWWLYFSPTGVFGDSQGLLKLVNGPDDGPYYPQKQGTKVTYCVTDPNTRCVPASSTLQAENAGNTIKVG